MRRSTALFLLLSLTCLPTHGSAQSAVTGGAVVAAGTVAATAAGSPPQTSLWSAGTPLPTAPLLGIAANPLGLGLAVITPSVTASDHEVGVLLRENVTSRDTASASLAADILLTVTVTGPLPVPAVVELDWTGTFYAGTPLPTVQVDFDNDGTFDLIGRQPNLVLRVPVTLIGSRVFRLSTSSALVTAAGQSHRLEQAVQLRVVPDHPAIRLTALTPACGGHLLSVDETFSPGIRISSTLSGLNPAYGLAFLVIGFRPALLPLPSLQNCILVPTPDIAVPFPAAPLHLSTANLGPQGFYVQGLLFEAFRPSVSATNSVLVQF